MSIASAAVHDGSSRSGALVYPVATSAALALLLAFAHVLHQAVVHGEQRRQAVAQHGRATWQCNALRLRVERLACLEQLRAVAPGAASQSAYDAIDVRHAQRDARP